MKRLLLAATAALVVAAAAQAQLIASEDDVRREARVMWLNQKRHMPIVHDQRVQNYVKCITNRVIAELPDEFDDVDWEVIVFDEDVTQASADANGKISVYSKLLQVADTPDALAVVLGHEIAHVTQGHVLERARKSARQNVWSTLGGAVVGSSDLREYLYYRVELPFAREHETEADLVGLDYMAKAGFDPRASVYLWKAMSAANAAQQQGQRRVAEMASTHPTDAKRLNDLASSLGPALAEYNAARDDGKRPNCSITGTG